MSGLDRSRKRRPTATMLGIAGRVRSLRFRFDRSPAQFAALVCVAPETVCAWERGDEIERDALVRIADMTGASLHWLISGLSPARIEAIRDEASRSLSARAGRADLEVARWAEHESDADAAKRSGFRPGPSRDGRSRRSRGPAA